MIIKHKEFLMYFRKPLMPVIGYKNGLNGLINHPNQFEKKKFVQRSTIEIYNNGQMDETLLHFTSLLNWHTQRTKSEIANEGRKRV